VSRPDGHQVSPRSRKTWTLPTQTRIRQPLSETERVCKRCHRLFEHAPGDGVELCPSCLAREVRT
jgi:hypothetical protein